MLSQQMILINVQEHAQNPDGMNRPFLYVLKDPSYPQELVELSNLSDLVAEVLRNGGRPYISLYSPADLTKDFIEVVLQPLVKKLFEMFGDDERLDSKYLFMCDG